MMLSRVTNIVMLVAVAALTIALVKVSHRNSNMATLSPVPTPSPAAHSQASLGDHDVLLLHAAFSTFDDEGDLGAALALAGPQNADVERDRSGSHSDRSPDASGAGNRGERERVRGGSPRMTEELMARCMEIAQEVDADLAKRLIDAREKNPDEFDRQMRAGGFGRRLVSLAQLKTHDPILYRQKISELSQAVQIERLAKQVRELRADPDASLGDLQSLEAQLRSMLQIQLAMSIKARGDLLCRFNERVAELQKELERDASNFQNIVDTRMKVLTSQTSAPEAVGNATE